MKFEFMQSLSIFQKRPMVLIDEQGVVLPPIHQYFTVILALPDTISNQSTVWVSYQGRFQPQPGTQFSFLFWYTKLSQTDISSYQK